MRFKNRIKIEEFDRDTHFAILNELGEVETKLAEYNKYGERRNERD